MERETIKISEYMMAPLVNDFAFDSKEYSHNFDRDGRMLDTEETRFWKDFDFVEDELMNDDIEDGYVQFLVILHKLSTNQYFKTYYTNYSNDNWDYSTMLMEVFPKQIMTTIYE